MKQIEIYFLLFILYACIGWIIEITCKFINEKHFINRGFLIGPYLPIYGYGALFITLTLTKYKNNIIILFLIGMLWCSILEYITSYIMEKIFKARWWDYSTYPWNINGRICLVNTLFFGIGGVFIIQIINPIVLPLLKTITPSSMHYICTFLFLILFIDTIISCNIIAKFSKNANCILQDRSEELSLFVKKNTKNWKENKIEEVKEKLGKIRKETNIQLKKLYKNKNILDRRLLKAFPNVEIKSGNIEKKIQKIIKKIRK